MEETRIIGHDAAGSSNPAQAAAERIVRDAEKRVGRSPREDGDAVHETDSSYLGMRRKEAPLVSETPGHDFESRAPASSHGQPLHQTTSSYLGMTRKETPETVDETPVVVAEPRQFDVPGADNPAPFSSALGIPTLLNENSSEPHEDNPAPLSSVLHIPTLVHESKPSTEQ